MPQTLEIDIGNSVIVTDTITRASVKVDPTLVTFEFVSPTGAVSAFTYPGTVTRSSTGVYTYEFVPPVPGTWLLRCVGSGAYNTAADETFDVDTSPVWAVTGV